MTRCTSLSPAHKGNDYLNANPKDTTESHMKVSVDLACEGGSRFQKQMWSSAGSPCKRNITRASSGRWKVGCDG